MTAARQRTEYLLRQSGRMILLILGIFYLVGFCLVLVKMTDVTQHLGFSRIGFRSGLQYLLPRTICIFLASIYWRQTFGFGLALAGFYVLYYGLWDYLMLNQFDVIESVSVRPSLWALLCVGGFGVLALIWGICLLLDSTIVAIIRQKLTNSSLVFTNVDCIVLAMFMAYFTLLPLDNLLLNWLDGTIYQINILVVMFIGLVLFMFSVAYSLIWVRQNLRKRLILCTIIYATTLLSLWYFYAYQFGYFALFGKVPGRAYQYVNQHGWSSEAMESLTGFGIGYAIGMDYGILSLIASVLFVGFLGSRRFSSVQQDDDSQLAD